MNILYIVNIRFPTEKAHGAQIAKTCEALQDTGVFEGLFVPRRRNSIKEAPFEYYGIRKRFLIRRFWTLDTAGWGFLGFMLQSLTFSLSVLATLHKSRERIIYGRDLSVLWLMQRFGKGDTVWETHIGSWNYFARSVTKRARGIVTISEGLRDFYIQQGVPAEKILVAPDAIDLADFEHPESKAEARTRLGLPLDKKIVLYVGRLDGGKGVTTLCDAASSMPPEALVAVIGGEPAQISVLAKKYPLVRFLGAKPYRELADNQAAADVLVLPNSGSDPVSSRFTSPMKLFSYMASGVPIVASDVPAIREVLTSESALFFTPDDPSDLARKATVALRDEERAGMIARRARADVENYTWTTRAKKIVEFLHHAQG